MNCNNVNIEPTVIGSIKALEIVPENYKFGLQHPIYNVARGETETVINTIKIIGHQ